LNGTQSRLTPCITYDENDSAVSNRNSNASPRYFWKKYGLNILLDEVTEMKTKLPEKTE